MNILNNAKDALIENVTNKKKLIFITTKMKNKYLYISIKDNAGGIKEDIIQRVFEPYFTTKHQGEGTGIGLYMTQELIDKHLHGEITVRNVSYVYEDCAYRGAEFLIRVSVNF
jgi:signal transduction histidine kinase